MKLTMIVGSGHKNSRCFKLAERIKDYIQTLKDWEIEIIDIPDLTVKDCLGCEYCLEHQNTCIIKDNMAYYYEIFRSSDALVIISPVYFSNIPGILKSVIDRCQLFFNLKDKSDIRPKQVIAIHVGGAPHYPKQFEAFENTYQVWLPDIKATLEDFITVTGTDKKDFLDDESFIEKACSSVLRMMKEKTEEN